MVNIMSPTRRLTPEEQNPYANLLEQAMKSYNAMTDTQYKEKKLKEELKKLQLYNEYYGRDKDSQIGLRGSQAGHLNSMTHGQELTNQDMPQKFLEAHEAAKLKAKYPFLSVSGVTGDFQRMMYLRELQKKHPELFAAMQQQSQQGQDQQQSQQGQDQQQGQQQSQQDQLDTQSPGLSGQPNNQYASNDPLQALQEAIQNKGQSQIKMSPDARRSIEDIDISDGYYPDTNRQKKFKTTAEAERFYKIFNSRRNSEAYRTATADVKNSMIDQATGMGIDPSVSNKEFMKGKDILQLAKEYGYDEKNLPPPIHTLTQQNRTIANNRRAGEAELQVVDKYVIEGLGKYANTIGGKYSPKQMWDQIRGKNKAARVHFLAASSLVPELSNLRLVALNAKSTVHALKEMQEKSMMNIKGFRDLVSAEDWIDSQKEVSRVIHESVHAANDAFNTENKRQMMQLELRKGKNDQTGYTKEEIAEAKEELERRRKSK